ncbi:unnamed protein product [Boreogadus saida]
MYGRLSGPVLSAEADKVDDTRTPGETGLETFSGCSRANVSKAAEAATSLMLMAKRATLVRSSCLSVRKKDRWLRGEGLTSTGAERQTPRCWDASGTATPRGVVGSFGLAGL